MGMPWALSDTAAASQAGLEWQWAASTFYMYLRMHRMVGQQPRIIFLHANSLFYTQGLLIQMRVNSREFTLCCLHKIEEENGERCLLQPS